MPSRLGLLCDGAIEAGWLVALVVTPLLFNVQSSAIFDPDKAAALRSVALLMVLAWIVRGLDGRGRPWRGVDTRWALLGLVFWAVQTLAALTSVAPRASLWGASGRLQGWYTTSAYLVLFLSVLAVVRRREQLDRVVSTALVVSLPVSLYGIIQHFGTDPVPWAVDVTVRVASTLGNPIFVAAFLVMTVPVTVGRHVEAAWQVGEHETAGTRTALLVGSLLNLVLQVAAWWIGPTTGSLAALTTMVIWSSEARLLGKPVLAFLRIGGYSVLLSAELACLLLSQSRGPWLGLVAGLCFFGLLWAVLRGRWQWAAAMTGIALALVVGLAVVNVPASSRARLGELPYVGRLARVFEGTGQVRLLIWQGSEELVRADPLRAVIGYGPETMRVVLPRHLPAALGQVERRGAVADRAHNETLDVLVTSGLLGLAVYLALFTALFVGGLGRAGAVQSAAQRRALLALWVGGGVAAALLSRWLDGSWRLSGVALPLGMLAGMFVFLGGCAVHGLLGGRREAAGAEVPEKLALAALLSAITGHFVEIQLGIGVTATRTYFWTFAGLAAVAMQLVPGSPGEPSPSRIRAHGRLRPPPRPGIVVASLVVSLVLVTLAYDFLSGARSGVHLPSVLWLFLATWALGGLIAVGEEWAVGGPARGPREALAALRLYAGITFAAMLLSVAAHAAALRLAANPAGGPVAYHVLLLAAVLAAGWALASRSREPARQIGWPAAAGAAGLGALVLALASATNIDVVRADVYFRQARASALDDGDLERAVALVRRALELQPKQDTYHRFLGETLARQALASTGATARDARFRDARRSMGTARALSPLDHEIAAHLAWLHTTWAQHTPDAAARAARFRRALAWHARAAARHPGNVLVLNEWGATYELMGDDARALARYRRSLALDDTFAATYLRLGDLHRRRRRWEDAARAYEQALARDARAVEGHRALGRTYAAMGRLEDAIEANRRVLALSPNDSGAHRALAGLYHAGARDGEALAHARRALELAPPQDRAALEAFIAGLYRPEPEGEERR
jgi:tetratricopeptide (TPR) repeat protein/O-antigen ligase